MRDVGVKRQPFPRGGGAADRAFSDENTTAAYRKATKQISALFIAVRRARTRDASWESTESRKLPEPSEPASRGSPAARRRRRSAGLTRMGLAPDVGCAVRAPPAGAWRGNGKI